MYYFFDIVIGKYIQNILDDKLVYYNQLFIKNVQILVLDIS